MQKTYILLFSILLLLLGTILVDSIIVTSNLKKLEKGMPQYYSGMEGCINAYLLYDTTINEMELGKCITNSIYTSGNLQSINSEDFYYLFERSNNQDIVAFKLLIDRKKGVYEQGDFVNLEKVNYFIYRFSRKDILLFEITMEEILNAWILSFSNLDIEKDSIDIHVGRPGGRFPGQIESVNNSQIKISNGNWFIAAEIPPELNFIKSNSDSVVLHGMWKSKDLEKNLLILKPAFTYNLNDTALVNFLTRKKLSKKGI